MSEECCWRAERGVNSHGVAWLTRTCTAEGHRCVETFWDTEALDLGVSGRGSGKWRSLWGALTGQPDGHV